MGKSKRKYSKSKDAEYLMLREEILQKDSAVSSLITLFYAFMATFLAFALTQDDSIYILISYIVILPTYMMVIGSLRAINRIAAYLQVFNEGENSKFNWETNLWKYTRENYKRIPILPNAISSHFHFIFSALIVTGLFFYKELCSEEMVFGSIVKCCCSIVLLIIVFVFMYTNRIISKDKYIERWEKIKLSASKDLRK